MTNDELFYDPDMDEEDERWVTKQREMNAVLGMEQIKQINKTIIIKYIKTK